MDATQARAILRNVFVGAAIRPEDMLRSCKAVLGSLPLVANALIAGTGKKVNVKCGIAELGATDGKTIGLMNLPIPRDGSDIDTFVLMLALAYGLIHHEVGHVNNSDFKTLRRASKAGALITHLLGIIEDVRQENVHIRRVPAARPYLDALAVALQITGHYAQATPQDPPIQALTNYLLYRIYRDYRGDVTVNALVEAAGKVVETMFPPGILIRLETLLPRMRHLENSDDALDLASDIASMLNEEVKKAQDQLKQQQQQQQQGSGTQSSPGGGSGSQSQSQQQPPNSASAGSGASGKGKSKGGKSKGKSNEGASPNTGNASTGAGGNGASADAGLQQQIDALQAALDGKDADKAMGDKSKALADALQNLVNKIQKDGVKGHVEMVNEATKRDLEHASTSQVRHAPGYDMAQALSVTGQLRVKLTRELQALTELDVRIGKRGRKVSSRHLHRIGLNDPRIFRTDDEEIDLDTSVALMIDVSGSMADAVGNATVIEVASQALYATAVAMEGLDGVEVAAATFPAYAIVKPFAVKARWCTDDFSLRAGGGTPMAEGVLLGQRLLASRDTARRILIVITDGQPNSPAGTEVAILAAERAGIEVFGLGIATDAGRHLFQQWSRIDSVTELPRTLMDLLRQRMLKAA